ncbi:MAG TPA: hypothetical protein VFK20_01860 [Vicinamibacterales bacterium]|nr:hypothetical protein [Vicinamibacterales bacterium]
MKPQVCARVGTAHDVHVPRETSTPARRVAVIVCHGMGQQVRFQTIDQVAHGLLAEARRQNAGRTIEPTVRLVRLGERTLGRAEIVVPHRGGDVHVDVYEGYWAPLTEGQIALWQVLAFLFKAGWQGSTTAVRRFQRYLFGGFVTYDLPSMRLVGEFALALAVLGSLVFINAVQASIVAAWIAGAGASTWVTPAVVERLSHDMLFLVIPAALLGAAAWAGTRVQARGGRAPAALWFGLWIAIVLSLSGAIVSAVQIARHLVQAAAAPLAAADVGRWRLQDLVRWDDGLLWIGVAAATVIARWFVLQYAGDVAIYLSGYRVSRFAELRDRIQDVCCGAARAVYAHGGYDQHVLVGHSLGSVVAYDVLNRLLVDEQCGTLADVHARTRALVTFGSPLDKTAYLFRIQASAGADIREALAAATQPLIADYANRPVWLNVWSPADPISASLDYYDDPRQPGYRRGRVRNRRDPQAILPVLAHTSYWTSPALYRPLLRLIVTESEAPGRA